MLCPLIEPVQICGVKPWTADVDLESRILVSHGVSRHDHVHGCFGGFVLWIVYTIKWGFGIESCSNAAEFRGHEDDAGVGGLVEKRDKSFGQAGSADGVGVHNLGILLTKAQTLRKGA